MKREFEFPEPTINAQMLPGVRPYEIIRIDDRYSDLKAHANNIAQIGKPERENRVLYDLASNSSSISLLTRHSTVVRCRFYFLKELTDALDARGFPNQTVFPDEV